MPKEDIFSSRKSLDEICKVPDRIVSVYSLEKHVWADSNSDAARTKRQPELKTVEEFQLGPVRPFLTDVLRNMAAPYNPDKRDASIGQGYWIQAEFGSGKSHLLCLLAALALGRKEAWDVIQSKEDKAGRGKRESLYRFWEEGLKAKGEQGKRGILVVVKTLVGAGGGPVGLGGRGSRLSEYILDAAKDQLQLELGKNVSLYPAELLADRFVKEDLDRYRRDLGQFLRDRRYFAEDEFEDVDAFIKDIQANATPEYKKSCGNKLWRFYTEYLRVKPDIPAENEDILRHLVKTALDEGYSGVLVVLDEVSLFMKNRTDDERADDEKALVVLANRLAKGENLPVWTVCAAQQAIESKMGVKNIIADDRLKLVNLLEKETDYYDIVLSRVREIVDEKALGNYYQYYKRGFSWPGSIGEQEFRRFFPFHKPALEVLRALTYQLTTTRSAIHVMHQTLKYQIKHKGRELIRLWELFDETVRYEEDPSGVYAGLVAIKTQREQEYRAYDLCKRQVSTLTKGIIKVNLDKAIKTLQTLLLYYLAKTRSQGITAEEIANSVMVERGADSTVDENVQHYETIADNLRKELRQVASTPDEQNRPRYRFEPVVTGVDPRVEFQKARDEAESNPTMQAEAWQHLLGLAEWPIRTRQMTIDLSGGVRSMFHTIAPAFGAADARFTAGGSSGELEVVWVGRQVTGSVMMRDLAKLANEGTPVLGIHTDQTGHDFHVLISTKPVSDAAIEKLLRQSNEVRIILWRPGELVTEERGYLLDFAAHRKLVADWQGKETEDALSVMSWVSNTLQSDLGKIGRIVSQSYSRGSVDSLNNAHAVFHVAGDLVSILSPVIGQVLSAVYESRDITFVAPFVFRDEEAVKVINGIVRKGHIPKDARPDKNVSAAVNFGYGLKIMRKGPDRRLDVSDNSYVRDIAAFIDEKLADDGQTMSMETLYKNFTGVGGPKNYGLSKRMVQLYVLCLVRDGKLRLTLTPRSGLSYSQLDYSNIEDVEFSARVLDAIAKVQKVAKPENWEILRPYAEKVLGEVIPVASDDAAINQYRVRLREAFAQRKDESLRVVTRSRDLFVILEVKNPYEIETEQIAKLYSCAIDDGDDIDSLLRAFRDVLGYKAYDAKSVSQQEVDDLANRLKCYSNVRVFLGFEQDLKTAKRYVGHEIPDTPAWSQLKAAQANLAAKLANIKAYVDSEVQLRTELIGKSVSDPAETAALAVLVREYTSAYSAIHDTVTSETDKHRQEILALGGGAEMSALKVLERVTALAPPLSGIVSEGLNRLIEAVFACPAPSRASVEAQLKEGPLHECRLSLADAERLLQQSRSARDEAADLVRKALDSKLGVLLTSAIRERLEQGKEVKAIKRILDCQSLDELRPVVLALCDEEPALADIIERYLKTITVGIVRLADFHSSLGTIERDQASQVAAEFQKFLEEALDKLGKGKDQLPMIRIE